MLLRGVCTLQARYEAGPWLRRGRRGSHSGRPCIGGCFRAACANVKTSGGAVTACRRKDNWPAAFCQAAPPATAARGTGSGEARLNAPTCHHCKSTLSGFPLDISVAAQCSKTDSRQREKKATHLPRALLAIQPRNSYELAHCP